MYQFHTFKHIHEISVEGNIFPIYLVNLMQKFPETRFFQDSNVLGVKHTQSQTEVTLAAQAADTAASTLL